MPKQNAITESLAKSSPARWPGAFDRATLAEYIAVSLRTVDKLAGSELPPDFQIGDRPRWRRDTVDKWIESKGQE